MSRAAEALGRRVAAALIAAGGGARPAAGGSVTVLVVRPRAQAAAWVDELRALGVAARALPLIEILPAPQPELVDAAFADVERAAVSFIDAPGETTVDADAPRDDSTRPLLVFVSPNAVDGFFSAIASPPRCFDARGASPGPPKRGLRATGPGTVAALREARVPGGRVIAPSLRAAQFDSEALWARIATWRWAGRPVWLVRGNGGRDWLGQQMRGQGAEVRVVQAYVLRCPCC